MAHPTVYNGVINQQRRYPDQFSFSWYQIATFIGSRASIVHGKLPEQFGLGMIAALKNSPPDQFKKTVNAEVAEMKGPLNNEEMIKNEIFENGPVLSLSFRPTEEFLKQNESVKGLDSSLQGQVHPVMIIGWKITPYGEAWLLRGSDEHNDRQSLGVSFGQYGIIEEVYGLSNVDLEKYPWIPGPHLSRDFTNRPAWRLEEELRLDISKVELDEILQKIQKKKKEGEEVSVSKHVEGFPVCVHEHELKAKSERYWIDDLRYHVGTSTWKLHLEKFPICNHSL